MNNLHTGTASPGTPTTPIVSSQKMLIKRRSICFCCAAVLEPDYTETFDLSGTGKDIIDICSGCLVKATELVQHNLDTEYTCDRCMDKTAVFTIDGSLRMCSDCQLKEAIQEMHNTSHVTFTDNTSEPVIDGIINIKIATAATIALHLAIGAFFMLILLVTPDEVFATAAKFWGAVL